MTLSTVTTFTITATLIVINILIIVTRGTDGEHARGAVPHKFKQLWPPPWPTEHATWRTRGQLRPSKWRGTWSTWLPQPWLFPKSC